MALLELGSTILQESQGCADVGIVIFQALHFMKRAYEVDISASAMARGRVRLQLSAAFNLLGRHVTALQYAQEAELLLNVESRRSKDRLLGINEKLELRAIALHNCCACHEHLGRYDLALRDIRLALECATRDGPLYMQLEEVEMSVHKRARRQNSPRHRFDR